MKYEKPEIVVISLSGQDVIMVSGNQDERNDPYLSENPW